jgi:hypothetical protein
MKDVAEVKFCVIDRGTFFPVAERLARDAREVIYHRPNGQQFETLGELCLGDGHEGVRWVEEFWPEINTIDCFVVPDCRDAGLQLYLESQGFRVWGSKTASSLEQKRGLWLDQCEKLGLPMPRTHRIKGLENLRVFLRERKGDPCFVKISRLRGDMETWEAKEPPQIDNELDRLAIRFGRLASGIVFYVQEPIKTNIESGSDTYNVWGNYPDEVIIGYEKKDKSYFATVKKQQDMPEEVWSPMRALSKVLGEARYANFISSEIRIADEQSFWLDPCLRCPSPAGEEQLEMLSNFSEIVWRGADGELVQPEWAGRFCGEALIECRGHRDSWSSITVPEEVQRWVKLYACAYYDGSFHQPPCHGDKGDKDVGCAVAIGDTPQEVLDGLKAVGEALKDQPVDLHIEPLAALFKEIQEAESKGIPFSDRHDVPEPSTVLT